MGNEDGGPCLNAFLIWSMVIFEHKRKEIGSLPAMFDGDNWIWYRVVNHRILWCQILREPNVFTQSVKWQARLDQLDNGW